jgi:hypothetical protein
MAHSYYRLDRTSTFLVKGNRGSRRITIRNETNINNLPARWLLVIDDTCGSSVEDAPVVEIG